MKLQPVYRFVEIKRGPLRDMDLTLDQAIGVFAERRVGPKAIARVVAMTFTDSGIMLILEVEERPHV